MRLARSATGLHRKSWIWARTQKPPYRRSHEGMGSSNGGMLLLPTAPPPCFSASFGSYPLMCRSPKGKVPK
eukprot:scaffold13732_cov147-Isochrysis_galbana.AAC.3